MFTNRQVAQERADRVVGERVYKSKSGRKSAQTQITNRKEREIDDWTRENVGLK